jgi:3-hydroxybutyrate dehydrogenase
MPLLHFIKSSLKTLLGTGIANHEPSAFPGDVSRMDLTEPKIKSEQILILLDDNFNANNVCIVTGAASGIGRAIAVAAAANNLTAVGLDTNEEGGIRTQQIAKEKGGQMVFCKTDLTDEKSVEPAVSEAAKFGQIKFLANIAGIQHSDSVENFPMEKYDLMQRLMLRAPFLLSKLCLPHMKKSSSGTGVIGNIASTHAHICAINEPVHNITKFGLRALSQSISAEGQGKIRSFTVSTGYVKTPLTLNQISAQAAQKGIGKEEVVQDVMLGKSRIKEMMAPIEVANLFIFGFSRYARYLVGGDLLFDGGMVLT